MSAAAVDLIAEAANLADPELPADRHESTRRLAVAAHLRERNVRRALEHRARRSGRTAAPLPEPGVDLRRIRRELRIAGSREAVRRGLLLAILGATAAAALLGKSGMAVWIGAAVGLFAAELGTAVLRRRHVRSRLSEAGFRGGERGAPSRRNGGGRNRGRALSGGAGVHLPGSGDEVDSIILSVDLGKPREAGRVPRHLRIPELEHDLRMTVRRLWLARLDLLDRWYLERPGGRPRRFLVLELPVGDEGGLLSTLLRFERRGDLLLVEARFRFLPPVSRAFRGDGPLNPRREAGGLMRDIVVSLLRFPVSWLGALGWIGSGAFRPVMAAIRAEDGVQERSLRESFADEDPSPALEAEVRQLSDALRGRLLSGLEEALVRRGICPGSARDHATRGDVVVAEERPARASRPPRRRDRVPRRRSRGSRR